jgi:hypothetical protein
VKIELDRVQRSKVSLLVSKCLTQRVLNDLQRARFSCGRIIRLYANPPSPLSYGAELYDRKKAWPSINVSILSDFDIYLQDSFQFHFFSYAQKLSFFAYRGLAKIMLSFPLLSHQILNYFLQDAFENLQ